MGGWGPWGRGGLLQFSPWCAARTFSCNSTHDTCTRSCTLPLEERAAPSVSNFFKTETSPSDFSGAERRRQTNFMAPHDIQVWTAHAPRPRKHRNDDWFGAGGPVLSHPGPPPGWSNVKTGTRTGSPRSQGIPDQWLSRSWKTDTPFHSGQWREETASSFHRDDEEYWSWGHGDHDDFDDGAINNVPSLAHAWECVTARHGRIFFFASVKCPLLRSHPCSAVLLLRAGSIMC